MIAQTEHSPNVLQQVSEDTDSSMSSGALVSMKEDTEDESTVWKHIKGTNAERRKSISWVTYCIF